MSDMRSHSRGTVLSAVAGTGLLLWLVGVALGTTTRAQEPANFRGGVPTTADSAAVRLAAAISSRHPLQLAPAFARAAAHG
jgi:hypothetical protein